MEKFSSEFDTQNLDKALKLKEKLQDNGYDAHSLDIGVTTDKIYEKGFQFATVAHNEYSTKQFEILEIAEKNLNNNLENPKLTKKFIQSAKKVKANLEEHYGDQWIMPSSEKDLKSESVAVQESSETSIDEIEG